MSEARKKQKQNPFPLRLEAQLKSKKRFASNPGSILGARKILSRVEMNAQRRGALDSLFRAGAPVCLDNGRCRHTWPIAYCLLPTESQTAPALRSRGRPG